MAAAECRLTSRLWLLAALALGLVALAVRHAPAQGGYAKMKADMAKSAANNAKATALNNRTAAGERMVYAQQLKELAQEAYAQRFAVMTDAQKVNFENAMASGESSCNQAPPHRDAGELRLTYGGQYMALGDAKYAQNPPDYVGAQMAYDCVVPPIGARQHYDFAASDFYSEYLCYNSAAQQFAIAYNQTQP